MANFFRGAKDFTINGGTFGDNHSRHTTYQGPVHRTNDHSTHTINYGGYVNRGQHASGGGTINNHGPQTTNNGPVYGYRQYAGSRVGNRRSPRPPSPPEEFDAPPIRPGQQNRRRYPPQDFGADQTYGDHDDDDDDDLSSDELRDEPKLPPPRRAQQPTVPTRRPQGKRPENSDDSLIEELRTLSPEMQRYIKTMQQRNRGPIPPVRPESELQDRMADMQLDDPESSRPSASRRSPHVRVPQNLPRRDPRSSAHTPGTRVDEVYRDNSPEDESEDDEDDDPASLHGRAIISSTDSNNVNSSTVVDSHNDNSTRTEITKGYRDR